MLARQKDETDVPKMKYQRTKRRKHQRAGRRETTPQNGGALERHPATSSGATLFISVQFGFGRFTPAAGRRPPPGLPRCTFLEHPPSAARLERCRRCTSRAPPHAATSSSWRPLEIVSSSPAIGCTSDVPCPLLPRLVDFVSHVGQARSA
ncbi:hypothetical protein EVAR_63716_1 [Eumeta japonica]|uniref:Uncharacterized protein n=1 Tax=Eumeta variegata TaxID=151549 RepID=A0A4C1ZZI3_EUMVA|nr:hypothetical protein EVAR_63716_1 [Eumeta japonica]